MLGLQSTGHGPQEPIAISFVDADHPIVKGMDDWTTIKEELYNNEEEYYNEAHQQAERDQGQGVSPHENLAAAAKFGKPFTNRFHQGRSSRASRQLPGGAGQDRRPKTACWPFTFWAKDHGDPLAMIGMVNNILSSMTA